MLKGQYCLFTSHPSNCVIYYYVSCITYYSALYKWRPSMAAMEYFVNAMYTMQGPSGLNAGNPWYREENKDQVSF